MVRHLELDPTEPRLRRLFGETNDDDQRSSAIARVAAGEEMALYLQRPAQVRAVKTGTQTLIQPDLPSDLKLHDEIQVPNLVMWTPSKAAVRSVVSPVPEELHAANVTPSLSLPNEEVALKNLALSATHVPEKEDQPPAATTSPLMVKKNDPIEKAPVSVSQISAKPAPVPILSVSDFRSQDKSVILPPISESAGSKTQTEVRADHATNPSFTSNDQLGQTAGEAGQGEGAGSHDSSGQGPRNAAASETDHSGHGQENGASLFGGAQGSATVITPPKDGHFGAVVTGTSVEDQYPEIQGAWSGRLIYTVSLHVGLAQSWSLQYSLPRPVEAATAGNVAHLEAPWPYNIVRPNLSPGSINADALIVTGFINQDGVFEALKIIVPPSFPQSEFVLECLRKWQFRPAAQGGHPTRVEVMLIIPDSQ